MTYALVTGGNRGLGLEVCKKLVQLNKLVIFTARSKESGKAVSESLGPACRFYKLDTSDAGSIQAFVEELQRDLPGQQIDLLINNAGVLLREWTKENLDLTFATNVAGPVSLIRALEPQLKDGALVINVSSAAGTTKYIKDQDYIQQIRAATSVKELTAGLRFNQDSPQKGELMSSYSLSKAALSKATTLMSEEPALKERHISLVSVCPGWCRTDMGSSSAAIMETGPPPRSSEQGADSILWPFQHFTEKLNGAYLDETGKEFENAANE